MDLQIEMTWDPDASVCVAESDDVPGLVMESGSFDALLERVRFAIPELLSLNSKPKSPLRLSFVSEKTAPSATNTRDGYEGDRFERSDHPSIVHGKTEKCNRSDAN